MYRMLSFPESEVTYSWAQQHLAELMDQVLKNNTIALITHREQESVTLLPAQELSNILETLALLRSPVNAQRLFSAIARAESAEGTPQTLEDLKTEIQKTLD